MEISTIVAFRLNNFRKAFMQYDSRLFDYSQHRIIGIRQTQTRTDKRTHTHTYTPRTLHVMFEGNARTTNSN